MLEDAAAGHQHRRLTVLNEEPFVYSIKNFLTKAEIEYMKNVVKDTRLKRSYTDDGGKTKKKKMISLSRLSSYSVTLLRLTMYLLN